MSDNESQDNQYGNEYSEDNFWDKVKTYAKKAGEAVLEFALKMYYATKDKDTPVWAKTTIAVALGYFISPVDAIPDITPVFGYSDDLTVLVLAASAVAAHIKKEHVEKAKETMKNWFS